MPMASRPARILFDRDVPARMRDGMVLRAAVWRPSRPSRFPVLLQRFPYDKSATVVRSFTPRVLEALRPSVERLVGELLDRVAGADGMDAIAEFASAGDRDREAPRRARGRT